MFISFHLVIANDWMTSLGLALVTPPVLLLHVLHYLLEVAKGFQKAFLFLVRGPCGLARGRLFLTAFGRLLRRWHHFLQGALLLWERRWRWGPFPWDNGQGIICTNGEVADDHSYDKMCVQGDWLPPLDNMLTKIF